MENYQVGCFSKQMFYLDYRIMMVGRIEQSNLQNSSQNILNKV